MLYARVAVKDPGKEGILTYSQGEFELQTGDLVSVPLGRRETQGCVLEANLTHEQVQKEIEGFKIKDVVELFDRDLSLSVSEISLYRWMAKYYHYNLGMIIFESLPKILKRPRKIELQRGEGRPLEHQMSSLQRAAYDSISKRGDHFDRYYIHGVTGSGKTLIYLNLIRDTLSKGKVCTLSLT